MGNRIVPALCLWVLICSPVWAAEKIASLNACTDELLIQLADPVKIAGVTRLQHSPPSQNVLKANSGIARMAGDVEAVLKVHPEIVLAGPFSNALLLERVREAGITVRLMDVPRSWEELIVSVSEIEKLTNQKNKTVVLKRRIAAFKKAAQKSALKNKRAVFWSAAGHVSGRETFENEIIKTLAMQNAADFSGYAFYPLEKLIQLQPEVIIVTQNPGRKDFWNYETLFHPALKAALPDLKYIFVPEEAASCASPWTMDALEQVLKKEMI